jgi:hypothetical protein
LKSAYRREPISGFILTIGLVDAVIGGVSSHWLLLAVGLGIVSVAIALRWWKVQQVRPEASRPPVYYLPDHSSMQSLPVLRSKD